MKLDFIENYNEYNESLIRLFEFDKSQAILFRDLIQDIVVQKNQKLDLSQIDFIEGHNCNLILGQFKTDEGILSRDNKTFFCMLTIESYHKMLELIEPFCLKESKAYQYLYDVDNPIDFLFAPAATQ